MLFPRLCGAHGHQGYRGRSTAHVMCVSNHAAALPKLQRYECQLPFKRREEKSKISQKPN